MHIYLDMVYRLQFHWLFWGYRVEFLGENTFFELWIAGCLFFIANVWLMTRFVLKYDYQPLFVCGTLQAITSRRVGVCEGQAHK